jgi:hypothetical protein
MNKSEDYKTRAESTVSTFDINNIIFNKSDKWELPPVPQIGTVGCFTADRAPRWDLFFVVSVDEDSHRIHVIFPHIRYNQETSKYEQGQDRRDETVLIPDHLKDIECVCDNEGQGSDSYCTCGAFYKNKKNYNESFVKQSADMRYKVYSFIHFEFRKFNWIYHEFVTEKNFDSLSNPEFYTNNSVI